MEERELFAAVFDARRSIYAAAEIAVAAARVGDHLELNRGTVRFLRSAPPDRDMVLDFGRLVLQRKRVSPEAAFRPLAEALSNPATPISAAGEPRPAPRFDGIDIDLLLPNIFRPPWLYHLELDLPNAIGEPRYFGWPAEEFHLAPKTPSSWLDPRGPIGNARLGVFPNATRLIDQFIEADLSRWPGAMRGILTILPDYRARFVRAIVRDQAIEGEVESGLFPPERLFYRAAADDDELVGAREVRFDSGATTGSVTFNVPEAKNTLQLYLMDRESDDIIDWVNLTSSSTYVSPDVVYESAGGQTQRLIAQGEGQYLEFKQEVGDSKRLLQSVVAFSNSGGGTILVGIADDGTPARIDLPAVQERIERAIRLDCLPTVTVEYAPVDVSGLNVLMVRVSRGASPPYQHRPSGVYYVRRGRSNFAASPDEIRALATTSQRP